MEQSVLSALLPTLYAGELEFSETTDKDLAKATGINNKQMRGVLGSLTQKGIIHCDTSAIEDINWNKKLNGEKPVNFTSFVHLNEEYFYLHTSHK